MRWPWQRKVSTDRLIVSWSGQTLSYVRARVVDGGRYELVAMGVEVAAQGAPDDLVEAMRAKGLMGLEAQVMLRPEQYQVLQIETPAVAPEELRSAARYQIREMVDIHIDDITLDVMRVGDGQQKAGGVFVIVAANAVVNAMQNLGKALQWPISVIDIQETAQRNLQTALASQRDSNAQRADAALVISGDRQAILTISANGELFYTRRLDLPESFMSMNWSPASAPQPEDIDSYTPVDEYVPGYAAPAAQAVTSGGSSDSDKAQRLLVEFQRSLDLWDRSWSHMPLGNLQVYAGDRSAELARWLSQETGLAVVPMDVDTLFPGIESVAPDVRSLCFPLLGVLMRTAS